MHYLAQYQTFKTTQELNTAIYEHIKRNTYDLNETDRTTLKTIARYAVKFAGAAHLKAATLAGLIGKSEKTARRVINKLQSLGIVKKIATTRKVNGGKGANIIQVLPLLTDDQSCMSSRTQAQTSEITGDNDVKFATEPSYSIKHNLKSTLLDTTIPSEALKSALPSELFDAMARYFDAEGIYKYYGVLLRAKASVSNSIMIEDSPQDFVTVFHNAILKTKQGKIRNLANYLYEAWRKTTEVIIRRQNFGKSHKFFDWLNE